MAAAFDCESADFPTLVVFDETVKKQIAEGETVFAIISACKSFAQGTCRLAFKGITGSPVGSFKRGDRVVVKAWLKEHVMTSCFWSGHLSAEKVLNDYVTKWNEMEISSLKYEMVQSNAYKWIVPDATKSHTKIADGEWCLAEPFLNGVFTKWNSNTTTVMEHWAHCIQAFCHWTYHESGGKHLCCDAQGVETDTTLTLTDPCVVSDQPGGGLFGITDGGPLMAAGWFARHRCNCYCDKRWLKPSREDRACAARLVTASESSTYTSKFKSELRTKIVGSKAKHITPTAFAALQKLLPIAEGEAEA